MLTPPLASLILSEIGEPEIHGLKNKLSNVFADTELLRLSPDKQSDNKTGVLNLASKLGQIGHKWDKSGTF